MPALRESYEDTLAAAEGADLLVTMLASYATRLVAEKTGIPWVSAVHVPDGVLFNLRSLASRSVPRPVQDISLPWPNLLGTVVLVS